MSLPWEWIAPLVLLAIFGTLAARAAHRDRSPRKPQLEWWWNRRPQDWWAKRPGRSLRGRHVVALPREGK